MNLNIVLITADQMRGDCLGILGHPVLETPYIDNMANNGMVFTNAYSATPTCVPARASLLTGLSQKNHGRVGYQDCIPWNYEYTIPKEMASAGYHTQCIGKMHVYPTRSLMGFHNVILHDGYMYYNKLKTIQSNKTWEHCDDYIDWLKERLGNKSDITDYGLECNSWIARPWPYEECLHPTNWLVSQSIDFLRRRDIRKPLFLHMSFVRPHSPLDPPEYFFNQYKDMEISERPLGDWCDYNDEKKEGLNPACIKGNLKTGTISRARAAYYGLINHIDHQIGRFLLAMGEYGLLKNTIFIFTSDHGDMLGDHNLYRKAWPYQGSIRIPLILYDPGNNLNLKRGTVNKNVVELRDIMPTLLDCAGINIPASVDGKSIIELARGKACKWREYLHGEHSWGNYSNHYIVTEKDKFIWYSQTGEEQYFDLINDPDEKHNAINDDNYFERIKYLRSILIKELRDREEGYSDGNSLFVGKKPYTCLNLGLDK